MNGNDFVDLVCWFIWGIWKFWIKIFGDLYINILFSLKKLYVFLFYVILFWNLF